MPLEPGSRRKYSRISFDRQVDIELARQRYTSCQVFDLSLKGLFVAGDFGLHNGEHCLVNLIQKSKTTELSLQAMARVVRTEEKGIALEFTSMALDSYLYLQALLLNGSESSHVLQHMLQEQCPFQITEELLTPAGES